MDTTISLTAFVFVSGRHVLFVWKESSFTQPSQTSSLYFKASHSRVLHCLRPQLCSLKSMACCHLLEWNSWRLFLTRKKCGVKQTEGKHSATGLTKIINGLCQKQWPKQVSTIRCVITVEPLLTDTPLKRTPLFSGHLSAIPAMHFFIKIL